MTELLVGTKKGLFVLEGEPGSSFEIASRHFAGEPVEFATRDARTGRTFAAVTSAFYGPKIFYTDDLAGEWQQAAGMRPARACCTNKRDLFTPYRFASAASSLREPPNPGTRSAWPRSTCRKAVEASTARSPSIRSTWRGRGPA